MFRAERLTIVQNDAGFVVTDGEGVSHTLTPDGKTSRAEVGSVDRSDQGQVGRDRAGRGTQVRGRRQGHGSRLGDRRAETAVVASKLESNQMSGDRARTFQRVYDLVE